MKVIPYLLLATLALTACASTASAATVFLAGSDEPCPHPSVGPGGHVDIQGGQGDCKPAPIPTCSPVFITYYLDPPGARPEYRPGCVEEWQMFIQELLF